VVERFPLITVTCVAINNKKNIHTTVFELTEILAGLKKNAKEKINFNENHQGHF